MIVHIMQLLSAITINTMTFPIPICYYLTDTIIGATQIGHRQWLARATPSKLLATQTPQQKKFSHI